MLRDGPLLLESPQHCNVLLGHAQHRDWQQQKFNPCWRRLGRNSQSKPGVFHLEREKRTSMAAPDRFIAWSKQEQASIEQQLELMKTGKVRTGEDTGAGWVDTTSESMERARARLAELDSLLTES